MQNVSKHRIVFYDGACVLCNRTVNFLIKADRNQKLKFAPLGGTTAKSLNFNEFVDGAASVVFYNKGNIYYRSTAILNIIKDLPFPWNLLYIFWIVPTSLRDYFYRIVGKNRYKWFGRTASCLLYDAKYKGRFLD